MTPEAPPGPLRVVILGGESATPFEQVVRAMPEKPGLAVVVAAPGNGDLAGRLRSVSAMPVVEVRAEITLEPDRIYVLPAGHQVGVRRRELVIDDTIVAHAPLDLLLRSFADELGRDATAVILSGKGSDGALGIKRMKEAGALTIAQRPDGEGDEMPRAAIATGFIDLVLGTAEIASRLQEVGSGRPDVGLVADLDERLANDSVADTLRDILAMIRMHSGHDFASYKRATLYRRVARRMQVCQTDTIGDYHRYLREHPTELVGLMRDFLISVTNFFRDPDAFEALDRLVLPRLFAHKTAIDQIRVWIAGCATGEEAYSIGMLLCEHASRHHEPPQLQVFATDIDEEALAEARAGTYPDTIAVDVSPERLERFFTREAEFYRVNKELREIVLFSPHNVLRDPPFTRLDLISCRNVLIYLNHDAQDRVLNVFHFGLRPDGFLFLGSSESAETAALQFAPLDAKQRLFTRRLTASSLGVETMVPTGRWQPTSFAPVPRAPASDRATSFGELHHRLVERYAPPSVLVNSELEVVHISEHAGRFLRVAGGEPTRELLRLVHPALHLELRSAIFNARQPGHSGDTRVVRFDDGGAARAVELRVRSVELDELGGGALLVLFDELEPSAELASTRPPPAGIEPVVRGLEDELHRTRDQLRSTIEQYETSLEELKASNEELHAMNEELRSATEELETSKEELQSVNEELTTLNHELKVKVDEISRANNDLQNLMTSTEIGVLFLDRKLNIKRFTPRAQDVFNVIPTDLGRPLSHLTHRLDTEELSALAQTVLQHLRVVEREVRSRDGHRYLLRLLPYRSMEDRIEGVVLTLVDVSDLRAAVAARDKSEAALVESEERLRRALRSAPMVVLSVDDEQRITWGYAFGKEVADGASVLAMFATDHAQRFADLVREVRTTGTGLRAELQLAFEGRVRTYDFRIEPAAGEISAVGFDITPSKEAEIALVDADRRKDEFLATLSHELRNPLTPLKVALDVWKLAGHDPRQLAEAHAIMERQVAMLSQLVDELLDLSRITQGKTELHWEELDAASIVEGALEATMPLITQRRHRLSVALPPTALRLVGDRIRLVQVFTNLISNAAKYTPEGGSLHIEVEAVPERAAVAFRVRDSGFGIAPELMPHIFEIFVQSRDARGRALGGLGIGLNLVHRVVELHGGSVSATSAGENLGSEFVVELPRSRAATPASPPSRPS